MINKEKKVSKDTFANLDIQEGMSCGPEGCSLADHFDWAKDKSDKKNK